MMAPAQSAGPVSVGSTAIRQCVTCGRTEPEGGGKLQLCARCHEAYYCSHQCQKADWKTHKIFCGVPAGSQKVTVAEQTLRKKIVMLSLDTPSWFQETNADFYTAIRHNADLEIFTELQQAINIFSQATPTTVLLTDPFLAQKDKNREKQWSAPPVSPDDPKNSQILTHLMRYVHTGGTVLCMGGFSSFVKPPNLNNFLRHTCGLGWSSGEYLKTDHARNLAFNLGHIEAKTPIARQYSQKALMLAGVNITDAVYLPSANATTQSLVPSMAGQGLDDSTQTPIAFAKIGQGYFGYLGDVNMEDETQEVILAMCGLA